MATDHYGQVIDIGDRVTQVVYSPEFIISDILYGGDMVDLIGKNRSRNRPLTQRAFCLTFAEEVYQSQQKISSNMKLLSEIKRG